jgi:hypothetical protein
MAVIVSEANFLRHSKENQVSNVGISIVIAYLILGVGAASSRDLQDEIS